MEKKYFDMHTHSSYSDGELTPNELIELAINNNVGTIAITDHDTLQGVKMINKNDISIKESEIEIINGIELSAKRDKGIMHILGYNIDIKNQTLNNRLTDIRNNNIKKILALLDIIKNDYNITFNYDDIDKLINSNHNLGRPDIAKLCVKYGYSNSIKDAFDKYLISARNKLKSSHKGIDYEECLSLINNSKGISVLAHPKTLDLKEKDFLILLKELINCGLKGIEVYHSTHTQEEMNYYLEIANKYNLLISCGSDFHGKNVKPDIELGYGKNNNLKIKQLSLIDYIKREK